MSAKINVPWLSMTLDSICRPVVKIWTSNIAIATSEDANNCFTFPIPISLFSLSLSQKKSYNKNEKRNAMGSERERKEIN